MNRRIAEKEAYRLVPETCPAVDAAIEKAVNAIKEQTGNLREALVDAIEERNKFEEDLEDALDKIKELESKIEDMKQEIKELETGI